MTLPTELVQERIEIAAEIKRVAPSIGKDTEEPLADMYIAKQLYGSGS
jgi:hypothetical protein